MKTIFLGNVKHWVIKNDNMTIEHVIEIPYDDQGDILISFNEHPDGFARIFNTRELPPSSDIDYEQVVCSIFIKDNIFIVNMLINESEGTKFAQLNYIKINRHDTIVNIENIQSQEYFSGNVLFDILRDNHLINGMISELNEYIYNIFYLYLNRYERSTSNESIKYTHRGTKMFDCKNNQVICMEYDYSDIIVLFNAGCIRFKRKTVTMHDNAYRLLL